MTLSKETEIAIQAFKAWCRARDRYQKSLSSPRFERDLKALERAQTRLDGAVVQVPDAEFVDYFQITEKFEDDLEAREANV